ncbi:MAG: hypothetical protein R3292_08375 [Alcanivorax sp.]|nr:hypothetical protein [Alcanivorax sp.]
MTALIKLFWHFCLFRASPAQSPYSPALFLLVLAAWLLVQLLVASLQNALPVGELMTSQVISMAVVLAGCGLLLAFKRLSGRWLQTAMALVGVELMMTLVSLPLLLVRLSVTQPLPFLDGLYLMLISWQLAAQGFIYHRSLSVSPFLGLGVAITLLIVSYALVVTLMPQILASAANG